MKLPYYYGTPMFINVIAKFAMATIWASLIQFTYQMYFTAIQYNLPTYH
jgi:hypothetical protein